MSVGQGQGHEGVGGTGVHECADVCGMRAGVTPRVGGGVCKVVGQHYGGR